jgi:hypothetical protein
MAHPVGYNVQCIDAPAGPDRPVKDLVHYMVFPISTLVCLLHINENIHILKSKLKYIINHRPIESWSIN